MDDSYALLAEPGSTRQTMLLSGLDCLPGQVDLWDDLDKQE